jgi:glioma pathogenesis-related protein 2
MSVILHAALPAQHVLSEKQKIDITNYINQYRKAHNSPPLIYDPDINLFAQTWSNYLLNNNLFQHSGSQTYGENLAYFKGYGTDTMTLLKLAIDLWYNEVSLYNFDNPKFTEAAGHFTCLVWKSSVKFGIGFSIMGDTVVVSMNTSPPGNVTSQFADNVLPRNTSIQLPTPAKIPDVTSSDTPDIPYVPYTPYPIPIPMPGPTIPISPIPSPVFEDVTPKQTKTIFSTINVLHKIINELNKARPNKYLMISYIKNIISNLVNYL